MVGLGTLFFLFFSFPFFFLTSFCIMVPGSEFVFVCVLIDYFMTRDGFHI